VMTAWTPEGTVGAFFRIGARFQPPPPPGAGSPLAWGEEEHVQELLGDTFELSTEHRISRWREPSLETAWEAISTHFGPVVTALQNLPAEQAEQFVQALREHLRSTVQPDGRILDEREYLLISGTRR
jgi:hypothetical protein